MTKCYMWKYIIKRDPLHFSTVHRHWDKTMMWSSSINHAHKGVSLIKIKFDTACIEISWRNIKEMYCFCVLVAHSYNCIGVKMYSPCQAFKLPLVTKCLTVAPTPWHELLPQLVAKKYHSAFSQRPSSWKHRLINTFLIFVMQLIFVILF